ncbi:MAG: segregation and condensation protein [Abditibacteriota bacterium]|nr:segregation and condensation protein [Abditibacteriota bacterium]
MSRITKADIIEALLFASDRPVSLKKLAQVAELDLAQTVAELAVLREEKEHIGALQLVEVAEGWQIVSKPQFAPFIRQLREVPKQRLSRAAFEVLAIVAYRQPLTRAEIEAVRSVDCAGPIQFLLEKKLIAFAGRKDAPGRPWLYETTGEFLNNFGLRSLEDLPSLSEWNQLNAAAQSASLFNRGAMRGQAEETPADVEDAETEAIEGDFATIKEAVTSDAISDGATESEEAPIVAGEEDDAKVDNTEAIETESGDDVSGESDAGDDAGDVIESRESMTDEVESRDVVDLQT